jgi:hypothetical protein
VHGQGQRGEDLTAGGAERGPRIPGVHLVTMARYEEGLEAEIAFTPISIAPSTSSAVCSSCEAVNSTR